MINLSVGLIRRGDMKETNKRQRRGYSELRAQLRRERQAEIAKLTPSERLRRGLELSDFCLSLAARGREFRTIQNSPHDGGGPAGD